MKEYCFLMIKPEFANNNQIIEDVKSSLSGLNVEIKFSGFTIFNKEEAKEHYIRKKEKSFFDDLVDYISSDKVYGMIIEGDNAICQCRELTEKLRHSLKLKYFKSLNDESKDLMRNIIHCTDKDKVVVNGQEVKIDYDSAREITNFMLSYMRNNRQK